MRAKKKRAHIKHTWSDTFKRGFAAGYQTCGRRQNAAARVPIINIKTCKSVDRAACRAIEGRHLGNDNGILRGYRHPY